MSLWRIPSHDRRHVQIPRFSSFLPRIFSILQRFWYFLKRFCWFSHFWYFCSWGVYLLVIWLLFLTFWLIFSILTASGSNYRSSSACFPAACFLLILWIFLIFWWFFMILRAVNHQIQSSRAFRSMIFRDFDTFRELFPAFAIDFPCISIAFRGDFTSGGLAGGCYLLESPDGPCRGLAKRRANGVIFANLGPRELFCRFCRFWCFSDSWDPCWAFRSVSGTFSERFLSDFLASVCIWLQFPCILLPFPMLLEILLATWAPFSSLCQR